MTTGIGALWDRIDRRPQILAALVFVGSLLVYVPTLAPGLLWGGGDFATFQTWIYTGEGVVSGAFGHPLWVIVSHPFVWLPVGDVAYRANLAAAVYAAAALVFVCLSARLLTSHTAASVVATAVLLVSHTFWTYAVMPKVYSLNALLLAASLYLVLRWGHSRRGICLYLFAMVYGLSLLNHLVMATAAAGFAGYVAVVAYRDRPTPLAPTAVAPYRCQGSDYCPQRLRQVLVGGAVFVASLVPYLALAKMSAGGAPTGDVITTFLRGLTQVLTEPGTALVTLGLGAALLVYQFPVTCVAGVVGMRRMGRDRRAEAALLLLIALGDVAFLLSAADPRTGGEYIWNLHYYLQLYVVFAIWIAVGLAASFQWLWHTRARQAGLLLGTVALPVLVYALAPLAARPFVANMPAFRELPGRDNLTYVLSPWKHNETGPRALVEDILQALPPGSVLYADYGVASMLDYMQIVEHARPDVSVLHMPAGDAPTQVAEMLTHRDAPYLFIADVGRYYPVATIEAHFEIVPYGPVYRLIPRPVGAQPATSRAVGALRYGHQLAMMDR